MSQPASCPATVVLPYSAVYGYHMAVDPGAELPAPGSDPRTWRDYPCSTVVRLAPYDEAAATEDQRYGHDAWREDDDTDPELAAVPYFFCACRNPDDGTWEVVVLPGYLCGVDE